ncbi:VOC family protein [Nocardioides marmoribigeumensis]|uniref:Enzyme related to lactoylglutathione lyase n=1 Tax=Nocardioides marmoribigeumensis TaxID=433649 RepID=A0ABU2C108_9ACTN|nr:VOC family protein [Nocardioides marmoribigeumensis]MDR7364321.1 putative enzyme related to lactoylglutathione lyase [Nocardioides marmoribigeumensis]
MTSDPQTPPRIAQTVIDSDDPRALAEFYRQLFGLTYRDGDEPPPAGEPDERGQDWLVLRNPDGVQLAFQRSEGWAPPTWGSPTRPQMMHLDTVVDSVEQLDRQRERAEELGARTMYDRRDDPDEPLFVLVDPAGHPFCIFVA